MQSLRYAARAAAALVLLAAAWAVSAQEDINALLSGGGGESAQGATPELSLEQQAEQVQEKLAAAAERVANAEQNVSEERAAQLGVSADRLEERAAALRAIRDNLVRQSEILADLAVLRETVAKAQAESEGFAGLAEAGPYSIRFVDEFRNEVDNQRLAYEAALAESRLLAAGVRESEDTLRTLRTAANQAREAAQSNTAPEQSAALGWASQFAQLRVEQQTLELQTRTLYAALARERVDLRRLSLELAQRKADAALAAMNAQRAALDEEIEVIFTEIAAREEQTAERTATAEKDLAKAREDDAALRQRIAAAEQEVAQAASDEARAAAEARRAALQDEAAAIAARIETATLTREQGRIAQRLYEAERRVWRERRDLLDINVEVDLDASLEDAQNRKSLVMQWRTNLDGQMAAVRSQLAAYAVGDAEAAALSASQRQIRTALLAREDLYSRASVRLVNFGHLIDRLIEDIQRQRTTRSWRERWQAFSESVVSVWNYSVLDFEDTSITVKKIVTALLVFIFGIYLSRFLARMAFRRFFRRFGLEEGVQASVERIVYYVMVVLVILFTLKTVSIPLTIFTIFGGALAIGVGFGAQNLINNFLCGLILLAERPIGIADIVEVEGEMGVVTDIGARATVIKLFSGKDMLIPNSKFLENKVINWTRSERQLRLELAVGVAYGSPTRDVAKLIMKAVEEHGKVLKRPEPVVIFENFGDSALEFRLYFYIALDGNTDGRVVGSDLRHRIDKLFREAGIAIPYPIRDIHLVTNQPIPFQMVGPGAPMPPETPPAPVDDEPPKLP